MRIENVNGLNILYPEKGMLLFKKSDKEKEYHEVVYLAKNDRIEDYAEVTHDYVYGHQYDETITQLIDETKENKAMLDLQADLLDYFVMNDSNPAPAVLPLMLFAYSGEAPISNDITGNEPNALIKYLAIRIKAKKLRYDDVINKYPVYKPQIDELLAK